MTFVMVLSWRQDDDDILGLDEPVRPVPAGGISLALGGFSDLRLAVALGAVLLALLMNLWLDKRWRWAVLGVYAALCLFQPAALSLMPLMMYVALHGADFIPLLGGVAFLMLYHQRLTDVPLWIALLLAGMLFWKDNAHRTLLNRFFQREDQSNQQALTQRRENLALQLSQENAVRLGVAQERNPIARDIHDGVGHLLTRGILQVAALKLATQDAQQREQLQQLKDTLDTAMTATRHSVHNTRQDALFLDQEVQALVDAFTFCEVRYTNQSLTELSLNQKYVLMAIIQEALNNVMKHSNATLVTITLSQLAGSHALLIADNGTTNTPGDGTGLGLSAMEERVRGLGGTMHIAREKGFRLFITLPTEERHEHHHRG